LTKVLAKLDLTQCLGHDGHKIDGVYNSVKFTIMQELKLFVAVIHVACGHHFLWPTFLWPSLFLAIVVKPVYVL